jgi:hypothetical protein
MPPAVPPPVMPPIPTTGGIILKSATGAAIVVNDLGIFISDGKGGMISVTLGSVALGCPGAPLALLVK